MACLFSNTKQTFMKTNKHLIRFPGFALTHMGKVHFLMVMMVSLLCLTQSTFAFSFSPLTPPHPNAEWVLDKTVSNVDFYYMISECDGKKVVFLKFNNRNDKKVKVSWKEVFSTQFEKTREGFKGEKQLVLSKGETLQDDCKNVNVKQCIVLPSEVSSTYLAEIISFTFSQVRVSDAP